MSRLRDADFHRLSVKDHCVVIRSKGGVVRNMSSRKLTSGGDRGYESLVEEGGLFPHTNLLCFVYTEIEFLI